jgi:uncharacterized protein YjbJ (UPF0337 family)
MNADQFKGKWMQFKGAFKQRWGKLMDDDLQQIEGNDEKYLGIVLERYGNKREELMRRAYEVDRPVVSTASPGRHGEHDA